MLPVTRRAVARAAKGGVMTTTGEEAHPQPEPAMAAAGPLTPASRAPLVDQVLKISVAAAILFAGLGVGYYYAFYLPQKDARARADAQAAAAAQAKAQQDAEAKRTAGYKACLDAAQTSYRNDWNSNCMLKADEQEASYRSCLGQPYASPEQCRASFPPLERMDCSLPVAIAGQLNDQLDKSKARCVEQARAGLVG